MIGFNKLGQMGRIGNQMFQCASLLGIAKNNGYECIIPDHSQYSDYGLFEHHELQACFKMSYFKGRYGLINSSKVVHLRQYHFDDRIFSNCPDDASLMGGFESERYFKHVEHIVRDNYEFNDNIFDDCSPYINDIIKDNPVAIVVRRGNYLDSRIALCHPLCSLEYYQKAMNMFEKDREFLIFSDDMPWCKSQKLFQSKNVKFADYLKKDNVYSGHHDLCMLSMCQDFIIANSTFSWWGAWLSKNKNKKVYAPSQWFSGQMAHWDIKDQIPTEWIRI